MAVNTKISWTDSTFNGWWGCTKIAPGCDNCYAAALDKRTGGNHWKGPGNKDANMPRLTSDANWRKPLSWNRKAEAVGRRHRVFCGSMMDWCDKNAPEGARDRLFALIRETPWLDWQLLTKRASLIERCLPADWGEGYENVWLGVTVEDIEHGFSRVKHLSKIPAKVRFLSMEPLLEQLTGLEHLDEISEIDWGIVGGESGPGYREMQNDWADHAMRTLEHWDVPRWFKQWGGNKKGKGGDIIDGRKIKQWPHGHG